MRASFLKAFADASDPAVLSAGVCMDPFHVVNLPTEAIDSAAGGRGRAPAKGDGKANLGEATPVCPG